MQTTVCGRIESVQPESVAGRAGLRPGDCLFAINGHPLRDVIDVQFYAAEEVLALSFWREGHKRAVTTSRAYGEPLGIEFEESLFDGIRTCRNRCEFCFVAQMPRGLRPSLYLRDDDYRLSFLTGSFVTLTNLTEQDWARIEAQHLSPLYVSVHATDPSVRSALLQMAEIPDIREQLRRLKALGITVHTQVVCVPGLNDGSVLDQTIQDLSGLYPAVASVSVVPVGLTRFHRRGLRTYAAHEARALLDQANGWRVRFKEQFGARFVYPSDEFYLLAARPLPPAPAYDGFPQVENGVGLVRLFLDDWRRVRRVKERAKPPAFSRATFVTGHLFAPVLSKVAAEFAQMFGITVDVVPVGNRFFGETVTVAGLLTSEDVVQALEGQPLGDVVFLPRTMLDDEGSVTLDGRTPREIESAIGAHIAFVERMSDVLAV